MYSMARTKATEPIMKDKTLPNKQSLVTSQDGDLRRQVSTNLVLTLVHRLSHLAPTPTLLHPSSTNLVLTILTMENTAEIRPIENNTKIVPIAPTTIIHQKQYTQSNYVANAKHNCDHQRQCKECEKGFESEIDLLRYYSSKASCMSQEEINSDTKTHQCEICYKIFETSMNLKRHSQIHVSKKRFECQHCEKVFKTMDYKQRHERVHSDIKHYRCHICSLVHFFFLIRTMFIRTLRLRLH